MSDWSDHRQVICCLVCGEQQPLFSSSSRLARLPPASSPGFSPIPGDDSLSYQHPYLWILKRCQRSFLQVELVVVHLLPTANRLSACSRNIPPYPTNGSSHEWISLLPGNDKRKNFSETYSWDIHLRRQILAVKGFCVPQQAERGKRSEQLSSPLFDDVPG